MKDLLTSVEYANEMNVGKTADEVFLEKLGFLLFISSAVSVASLESKHAGFNVRPSYHASSMKWVELRPGEW